MLKRELKDSSPIERGLWSWPTGRELLIVFATWALLLACMGIAQAMGYRLGFAVWPMGEDRNWINILQDQDRYGAARAFWQIDDRNPLAPWGYIEQIYWTMQVALILSLCALTFYQLAIERDPSDYRLYASALVTWFFALATYGVQAGTPLAIGFLAFTAPAESVIARTRRTVTDALPFAALFLAFWLSWQTTARNVYTAQLHLPDAIASLFQALWHFDYTAMYQLAVYPVGYRLLFAVAASSIGLFVLFNLYRRREALPPLPLLLRTVIAAVCLMAPVIVVEASKHGIPGEGWRKIYQFSIPFLYLSIAAAIFWLLPSKAGSFSWCVFAASLAALATAATLGINRLQVEVTRSEKILRAGLLRLAEENFDAGHPPPYQFLIKRGPDVHWYASDVLSPVYARTWKFPRASSYRFLPDKDKTDHRFSLRFTEDGVENAALDEKIIGNPYIYPVAMNNEGVRRLCFLGPQDVKSPVVEWDRSTALQSSIGDCAVKR
jgi:hypothetical protein